MRGVDLGKLVGLGGHDDGMSAAFVHPRCPGARVYITRNDLESMKSGGEEFSAEATSVPPQGYGFARIRCGHPVQSEKGCAGAVVYYGLCHSCAVVEKQNRAELQAKVNVR